MQKGLEIWLFVSVKWRCTFCSMVNWSKGGIEMAEKRVCLNCGNGFVPTCHITRQKFCCDECRHKYNNAKRRYDVPLDICPECGATVEQSGERGQRRRFCSDQCRIKYHQKKALERRRAQERPKQICPNCGKAFRPSWGPGSQRRFCSDPCRIEWWAAYHKANPSEEASAERCELCGAPLQGKQRGQKYCSRFCYLLAMDQTHKEGTCQWCGRPFSTTQGNAERLYCSRECAVAGRYALRGFRKGSRRISAADTEIWLEKVAQAAKANSGGKRGKRVRLVCGAASMYTGLDGLISIIRYHLRCDPYDGSVYVFRDNTGTMVKYIEWDGQSFLQSKRRAQSGTYPWPKAEAGTVVELNEREFEYLLSRSIVPFKEKKCCND